MFLVIVSVYDNPPPTHPAVGPTEFQHSALKDVKWTEIVFPILEIKSSMGYNISSSEHFFL